MTKEEFGAIMEAYFGATGVWIGFCVGFFATSLPVFWGWVTRIFNEVD
jgi:hypothetical protein